MSKTADSLKRLFWGCFLLFQIVTIANAADIYVPDNYSNIQDAIINAFDNDTIIVRNGTYTGAGNYNIDFLKKAITVKSQNGPANCTINCQWMGRAFIFTSGETISSVLEGFTIINGYAKDPLWPRDPSTNTSGYGGAIYCKDSGPKIENCIIEDCDADSGGGAIFCYEDSNAVILNCDLNYNYCGIGFYNYSLADVNDINQLGGAIYAKNSSPAITGCTITYNWAIGSGGAIACEDSNSLISDCTINDNEASADDDGYIITNQHGGGIYCQGGTPKIDSCTLTSNFAKWSGGGIAFVKSNAMITLSALIDNDCEASGGGIYSEGNPNADPNAANCFIQKSLIAKNRGYWSGGVASNEDSFANIENCTIANNIIPYSVSPSLVGGLECYYGDASITNSIVWENYGLQIAGANDVTYCDVRILDPNGLVDPKSIWPGEGNINNDPLFADTRHDDYHLKTEYLNGRWNPVTGLFDSDDPVTSPCINAGNPFADYSFEPEDNGDRVNMGAYGNTQYASKSDIIRSVPADLNSDLMVDWLDMLILTNNWLLKGNNIINKKADLNNDGIVNMFDFALFAKFW